MAGSLAAGAAAGRNQQAGGSEPVSQGTLHRSVQPEVCGTGGGEGYGVSQSRTRGSGLGVHGADGASGEQGQHGGDRGPDVAAGEEPLPQLAGWLYGDDPRTLKWRSLDS